ncbi:M23 family metallopeptidase [Patescibacteria group bacterium]|nr:M23 family metallopeptidase [Patescibacteria group bacterium]MBU1870564.1 M23 family metallopeptidase [Patescibacteria group bacterium]
MRNILTLAKNLVIQREKSKKFNILAFVFVAKTLLSILILIIIGSLTNNTQNVEATYGLNPKIKQVKTADKATVYYLDHAKGQCKAYINAKAYLVYNNQWSDIKIINNKELNKWKKVKLVKSKNNPAVYYINNDQKVLIKSEQQFVDFGFQWSNIVTIAQADLDEYKENISFKIAGTINNYNDNQLLVKLDQTSPTADYLVTNTQDNLLAVYNLKANNQLIEIKKLILNFKGVFNTNIINEIYLTDENDIQYPVFYSSYNRQIIFDFNNQPLVINPNKIKKIKVYVNFNNNSDNIINNTIQVAIDQTTDIANTKVVGDFPIAGAIFKLISGSNYLGEVVVNEQSLDIINNNEAIVGLTEKTIGKFNLIETSGLADASVKELIFLNKGSAKINNLNNFKLKNKAGQIISIAKQMVDNGKVIFKLNNYQIKRSNNETLVILTNIVGGENNTINFSLDKAKIISSQGNFNLKPSIVNLDETIVIKRKAINVIAKNLEPSKKIFAKQAGVIIGVFEIRNNNQKINLEQLNFSLEKSTSTPALQDLVYLVNYDSGEVYNYFLGSEFNNSAVAVNLNKLNLEAKQNLTVALIANTNNNVKNGDYYKIIFNNLDYCAENNNCLSDKVNSIGAKLTVNKANLFLYPNNDLGEQSFIKGEKDIKIASFIVEAAAGADAKITSFSLSRGNSSGIISFTNGFSNLRAYINSSKIKTIQNPHSNDLVIDGFNYILESGSRAEIKIYVDTEADLKVSETQLMINNLTAVNDKSLLLAVVNNLNVNSYRVIFGQVQAEISKVAEGFVVKGEDDNVIAGFKVKNLGNEDLKLQSITINTANQELTYSLGYSNLKIIDRNKQVNAGGIISKPVSGANKINLDYIVKTGEEIIFDVHIKTNNNVIDKNIAIYFSDVLAKGKISRVSATISGDPTDSFKFVIVSGGQPDNNKIEKFIQPVVGSITYGFHDPNYPYIEFFQHSGIDYDVSQNTKIKAVAGGILIELVKGTIGDQASYVTIMHSATLATRYAHLTQINFQIGDKIKQGDIVGLSGGTPGTLGAGKYSNGPHLHFEVWNNGIAVDPQLYF